MPFPAICSPAGITFPSVMVQKRHRLLKPLSELPQ